MYFLVAGSAGWLFFLSRLLAVSWISELCWPGWLAGCRASPGPVTHPDREGAGREERERERPQLKL